MDYHDAVAKAVLEKFPDLQDTEVMQDFNDRLAVARKEFQDG